MTSLVPLLAEHRFFRGLDEPTLELLAGCAKNVRFERDDYLFERDQEANDFFLIRHGHVALEMDVDVGPRVVSTMGPGEILGWSWLIPPYHWHFSARAVEMTRALALDGACLRDKCEADHDLGYQLLKRFAHDLEERLDRAWLQMVDVYGTR
jgi:CRP-like cAMP-binding protein